MKMKFTLKCLCIIVLLCLAGKSDAQLIPSYTFSQQTGFPYVPLTDSVVIAHGANLENQVYPITLPFAFNLDDSNYTNIYVGINGFVSFGTVNPGSGYWMLQSPLNDFRVISVFDANLASSSTYNSELSYNVSGVAPNRRFTIQWKDFGYTGSNLLNVNCQLKLFEGDNTIQMTYGNCSLTGPTSVLSVQVGLRGLNANVFKNRSSSNSGWLTTSSGPNSGSNIVYQASNNPPSGLRYVFTPPPFCAVTAAPTNLNLTADLNNAYLSFSAPFPAPNKYLIIQTPGSQGLSTFPVNTAHYILGNSIGNGIVVYNGTATSTSIQGLTPSTYYTYTIIPYNDLVCVGGPVYSTANPLTGTIQTAGPKAYTWVPSNNSSDYGAASNWLPLRSYPLENDTLIFNNGGTDTVANVSYGFINHLKVTSNTNVTLNGSASLTLNEGMRVDSGSVITLGGQAMILKFQTGNPVKTALIYGKMNLMGQGNFVANNCNVTLNSGLNLYGTALYNANGGNTIANDTINIYDNAVVNATGGTGSPVILNINKVVNVIGSGAQLLSNTGNFTNFNAGAVFNLWRNGGTLPRANYAPTSLVNITGITNTAPNFNNVSTAINLGNLIWNCPGQSVEINIGGINSIAGNFTVSNTGTYPLTITAANVAGMFNQSNSTVKISGLTVLGNANLNSGVLDLNTPNKIFTLYGNLSQGSNHMITSSTSAAGNVIFSGTSHQNITIGGIIGAGNLDYTLNNINGATITGTIPIRANRTNTILNGYWVGTGGFTYESPSTLYYSTNQSQYVTTQEWPETNGPSSIKLSQNNGYPNNQIHLTGSRSVAQFIINSGVLVLDSFNLTMTGNVNSFSYYNEAAMIATNGLGRLIRTIPAGTGDLQTSYFYPIGDITGNPEYSPVDLRIASSAVSRKIGIKAIQGQHPNDTATTNYLARHWLFSDDGGNAALRYQGHFVFPVTNVVGNNLKLRQWTGTQWNDISTTVINTNNQLTNELDISDTLLTPSQYSLNNTAFTADRITNRVYSWTGAADKEYFNPLNWTPNRLSRSTSDVLQFNSGNVDTVLNISADVISRLTCYNNTKAYLRPLNNGSTTRQILTIFSDNDTATKELNIDSASSLTLLGTSDASLQIKMDGNNGRGVVNGKLELTSMYNECTITVNGTGSVLTVNNELVNNAGTSFLYSNFYGVDASSFLIKGTYLHTYSNGGGSIPYATWADGSVCTIKAVPNPNPLVNTIYAPVYGENVNAEEANFYKLIYDCPLQATPVIFSIYNTTVRDSFIVKNTGTNSLTLKYIMNLNHYLQSAGSVLLSDTGSSNTINMARINVSGTFMQQAGSIFSPTTAATTKPFINFNGVNNTQQVYFKDNAPLGQLNYKISNPQGIHLIGTGALTTNFDLDTNSSFEIAQPINSPVQTNLTLRYFENSSLIFDGLGNVTPDTVIYPVSNAPHNITVDIGNGNNVRFPGTRIIRNELAMISGNIMLDTANLTIGSSVSQPGKLTYTYGTSGDIIVSTGYLTRWYNTTGLPTVPDVGFTGAAARGYYPISIGFAKRHVALYFSSATALSAGGTIKVGHNVVTGNTGGLSIADGSYTVNNRSNTSWSFETGNGMSVANGSFGMRLMDGNLFQVYNPSDLRIIHANTAVGTHVPGSGVLPDIRAERNAISFADLNSGSFYLASAASNVDSAFISVTDGDWNTPSTWNRNSIPGIGDKVFISTGDTVSINGTANTKAIYVNQNARLNCLSGTVTVDSNILNYGYFSLAGSTITLGPVGGGNRSFTNNAVLDVSSGTLNINGNLALLSGEMYFQTTSPGKFYQTGGTINIDGNAGGVAANSVPYNTPLFLMGTPNVIATAGTINIIDPHVNSNSQGAYAYSTPVGPNYSPVFGPNHNFIFGNSISTDPGGSTYGFIVQGYAVFGNLIINGSPSGLNRKVSSLGMETVTGNIIVNNNGYLVGTPGVQDGYEIGGNIIVNAGGLFDLYPSSLSFVHASTPHLIGGAGTYGTSPADGSKLHDMTITGGTDVNIDIGDFILSGQISFFGGKVNLLNNSIIKPTNYSYSYNAGPGLGWINGKMIQSVGMRCEIGDATTYAPITIGAPISTVPFGPYVLVYTVAGDHPAIAGSTVNPAKSVNRYWVVDSIGPINNTTSQVILGWQNTDMDPGTLWSHFGSAKYINNNWVSPYTTTITGNSIILNNAQGSVFGKYQVGESSSGPVISQQPAPYASCSNTPASFSVVAQFAYSYQWQSNDGSGWMSIVNSANYNGAYTAGLSIASVNASMNNYQYRCVLSNDLDTVYSDPATLSVNTSIAPTITIATLSNDTICAATSVLFTSTVANGGLSPAYQWKLNGVNTGTGTGSLTLAALNNGDVVTCELTSSSGCAIPATAVSNPLGFTVMAQVTPSITIASSNGTSVCTGTNVTFTATTTNAGTNPFYQWKKNGVNLGSNSTTFSTSALNSNDIITCVLTSSIPCPSSVSVTSNPVTMTVNPLLIPTINISSGTPGTTICAGTTATFTATITNGGSNVTYQWKKNGSNVGTNSNTYSNAALVSNDVITCALSLTAAPGACYAITTANSNALTMTVNNNATPVVSITAAPGNVICLGQSATFNATVTNGGTTPVYQWKRNGTNVGANASSYTNSGLSNNDVISCTVTYGTGCFLPVTSNSITMTVNPLTAPSITISMPQGVAICSGSNVTFTAVAANAGNSPVYQWKKNNNNVGTNSTTYSDATLVEGDVINCVVTTSSTCASSNTATSSSIFMVINPLVNPVVTIVASQNGICNGTAVTFTATATSPGISPVYQWKKNNTNVGINSGTYTDATLSNNDVITCVLTSSAVCTITNPVTSNAVTMIVNPVVIPAIAINATQTAICSGTNVTFNAIATNGGTAPVYQWKKNGINVGSNTATYADASLNDGDIITCDLSSSASCISVATITSNSISMGVAPSVTPQVTIATNSDQLCDGNPAASITATAVNGGSSPVYQWKKNGINVGTNSGTYNDPAIADGDVILCQLTSNASCLLGNAVNSQAITFTVNPSKLTDTAKTICEGSSYAFGTQTLTAAGNYTEVFTSAAGCDSTVHLILSVTPVVTSSITVTANPGSNISNGQVVVFTASVTGGGSNPAISWKRNNVTITGATGLTWQGTAGVDFVNGNQIVAQLQSNAPCATSATVQSNTITMSVATGIKELGKPDYIKLYPNPTTSSVTVEGFKTDGQVAVYDMLGRQLSMMSFHAGASLVIPLEHYSAGTFTLVFIDTKGSQWKTKVVRK